MRVVISGSSGLVGTALVPELTRSGHTVARLVRRAPRADEEIRWDPATGAIDAAALEGTDAVVHLSGENLTSGRWTRARKRRLFESRVGSTTLLAETIAGLERKPRVMICASAIGIYGDRGDERLTESSSAGRGFLADLGRAWEGAGAPAEAAGIRVVHARFGLILSTAGGVLERLLPPFRLGLGGPIADGRAWWSWIAIEDTVAALRWLLENEGQRGAFNVVAPQPVRNRDLTRTLGAVLGRPTVIPVPAFVLRLLFGEMADEALLASLRVEPERLAENGFSFRFPELDGALRHALGK